MPGRELVLVVGYGRSGTSAATGALRERGLMVPGPEVRTNSTNPKGFGETQWVVERHFRWLKRARVAAQDARPEAWDITARVASQASTTLSLEKWLKPKFADNSRLLIKDPRMPWFLPAWIDAAARLSSSTTFVTMVRHPAEVVGSFQAHYEVPPPAAHIVASWLNMMLGTERATRGRQRVFISFPELISDPVTQCDRVESVLTTRMQRAATEQQQSHGFIDPSLHRVSERWDAARVPEPLQQLAETAWSNFSAAASDEAVPVEDWEALTARYERHYNDCAATSWSSAEAARGMPRSLRTRISPAFKKWIPLSALEWARKSYKRIPQSHR